MNNNLFLKMSLYTMRHVREGLTLPTPMSITYFWNAGSLLGLCLVVQIVSGILLTMHYASDVTVAFNSVIHIMRDENAGWIIRFTHANGASIFFMLIYTHMGRGVYFNSYKSKKLTWLVGVLIYLAAMAAAFLGYVLPWGQMSFWGATVITNLVSAIPYVGEMVVEWVWGGFSVANATLNRFYTLHFLIPFAIAVLALTHLISLHSEGSSNPLGARQHLNKAPFHPYFTFKDIVGFLLFFLLLSYLVFYAPYSMMDAENSMEANSLVTPVHIQPEWYFLFAYAILRSIPSKLGGVLALAGAIVILFLMPLNPKIRSTTTHRVLFWNFVVIFILLTWLGACAIEEPYTTLSQVCGIMYFGLLMLICFSVV